MTRVVSRVGQSDWGQRQCGPSTLKCDISPVSFCFPHHLSIPLPLRAWVYASCYPILFLPFFLFLLLIVNFSLLQQSAHTGWVNCVSCGRRCGGCGVCICIFGAPDFPCHSTHSWVWEVQLICSAAHSMLANTATSGCRHSWRTPSSVGIWAFSSYLDC